jgi:hypothetical protein
MHPSRLNLLAAILAACIAALAVGSVPPAAGDPPATYYFSTAGDDRADGLSPATPKRSLDLVPGMLKPGTTVLLKRGDVWHTPGLQWDLTRIAGSTDQPIRIGAYGDPTLSRPSIVAMTRLDRSRWSPRGEGILAWSAGVPFSDPAAVRLYIDGVPLRAVDASAPLAEETFRIILDRIEMRTRHFEGAPYVEALLGAPVPLIVASGTRYLSVEDLELRGGQGWRAARLESANHAVTFVGTRIVEHGASRLSRPSGSTAVGDTLYFSSTLGSDVTGDGSVDHPWKSLMRVPSVLAPGKTVLLRRGDTWHEPQLSWILSEKHGTELAPMVIGAYGDPALPRPVVADMVKNLRDEWRVEGGDVYSVAQYDPNQADDRVFRLFIGGQPLPKVPSLDSLVDNTYCVSQRRIYLKCSSFASYPFVETIQYTTGYFVYARDTQYLTIQDLELKGGDTWCAMLFHSPTDHFTIRNVYLHQFRYYGVVFGPHTSPDGVREARNITILDCVIDKGWTPAMNSEYRHQVGGINNGTGAGQEPGGDGILFSEGVDTAVVRGCTITNMGHSGIGSQYNDATLTNPGVRNITIEQNVIDAGSSPYCRAVAFSGPPRCSSIVIRRNYFHDLNVQSQFGGEKVYIYSNIFDSTHDNLVPAKDWGSAALGAGLSYPPNVPVTLRNSVVANNTLTDADCFFHMQSAPNDGYALFGNKFSNNLMKEWRTQREPSSPRTFNSAIVLDSTYAAQWSFKGNGFWKSTGDSIVLYVKRTSVLNDEYTVATLNARPNSLGNRRAEPQFVGGSGTTPDKFRLAASSPFINGGTPLDQLLPQGVAAVDFYGQPYTPSPSVGAIQHQAVALQSVAIGGLSSPSDIGASLRPTAVLTPADAALGTYAWEVRVQNHVVFTSDAAQPWYTPTAPGTYTVRLTVTDILGNARSAPPVDVWVTELPTIDLWDADSQPVAEGASTRLDVIGIVYNATTIQVTRNGQSMAFPADNWFRQEGTYVITAIGATTLVRTFTIDRTAPVVSGVANGAHYRVDVTPLFNEGTATLDGAPFTSGSTVSAAGNHTLVATDAAGNVTTVSFTIDKTAPTYTYRRKINGVWQPWVPQGPQPWVVGYADVEITHIEPNFDRRTALRGSTTIGWDSNPKAFSLNLTAIYTFTVWDLAGNSTQIQLRRRQP